MKKNKSKNAVIITERNGNSDEFIKKWLRSLTILHRGHWDAARHYSKVNLMLGMATVTLAAISGTTAFTQLQDQTEQSESVNLKIVIGLFALIAAAFGAIQSFLRPSELAAQHKQAAQKFGKLRREIEMSLHFGLPTEYEKKNNLLTDFRKRWEAADEESLPVPNKIYHHVEAEYDSKSK